MCVCEILHKKYLYLARPREFKNHPWEKLTELSNNKKIMVVLLARKNIQNEITMTFKISECLYKSYDSNFVTYVHKSSVIFIRMSSACSVKIEWLYCKRKYFATKYTPRTVERVGVHGSPERQNSVGWRRTDKRIRKQFSKCVRSNRRSGAVTKTNGK